MKSIFHNYKWSWIEIILLLISGALLVWAITSQVIGTGWGIWFETNGLAHIGSFMGGLFALVSVFYLIKNLSEQRHITSIQSFESNYLEIVKFCRDQVTQASIPDPNSSISNRCYISGREIFSLFFSQIEDAIEETKTFIQTMNIKEIFVSEQEYEAQFEIWGSNLQDRTIAAIAYLITYVGVRNQNIELLKTKYLAQYDQIRINELLIKFRKKLAGYAPDDVRNRTANRLDQTIMLTCDDKRYYGFQNEIGNYFRLLFQAVTYVDNQHIFSYDEKYKYVKILRAQMSDLEECVLFYNSLCNLGLAWEYNDSENTIDLITKYNLIKNIPANFTKVSFVNFYPNVYYEYLKEKPYNRKDYQ